MNLDGLLLHMAEHIRTYLNDVKKSHSLRNLAKKIGVDKNTLSRYAQKEVIKPNSEIVFRILSYFEGVKNAPEMMKNALPDWWNDTGKNLIHNTAIVNSKMGSIKITKYHFEILQLADGHGISDELLFKRFGEKPGVEIRDELIQCGLLENKRGINSLPDDFFKIVNDNLSISLMMTQLENFPIEKQGETSSFWTMFNKISVEATKKQKQLYREYVIKSREVVLNDLKSNSEKEIYFSTNVFSTWEKEGINK